ncbi:hypothetical protein PRK78_003532 [Emydomyces testavorans]|uniref:RED-like N-terminal domain-containing protein n=1 Tax=Emydomyces testavorans TaxID=2070801 RepID=A0AAF0DGE1_9EURO|nr:hypothetical protein PRK78_003532 [Emydomyces testavorans]
MNNEQFRRLLFDNPAPSSAEKSSVPRRGNDDTASGTGPKAAALGSRMRSSIPMTPRSVASVNFTRQLAEFRQGNQPPPTKKFKTSAPKGTKYTAGYVDRTLLRRQTEAEEEGGDDVVVADGDSRAKRAKALEEMARLGQIDRVTFEKMRDDIGVDGHSENTQHIVKGLDWRLLHKTKAGEDIATTGLDDRDGQMDDDDFERVLEEKEKDVVPVAKKEEKVKRGTMAAPPIKMNRDEILKQLKASRKAGTPMSLPQAPPASTLGEKFKKIGLSEQKKRWIETDATGRQKEVLLVTDSEGKTKRKIRWLDTPDGKKSDLLAVDKSAKPLGMEVPAEVLARAKLVEEPEDDDIFEGVGDDYNPLADVDDTDSSSESEKAVETEQPANDKAVAQTKERAIKEGATQPRNYFSTSATIEPVEAKSSHPLSTDPTILAALKRAATIRQRSSPSGDAEDDEEETDEKVLLRRQKFLEEAKRREREDALDLDLGFGESRFADDDEDEEVWDERGAGTKRKRGPKKKKGNKDSVSDVMKVLEGRRKGGEKK